MEPPEHASAPVFDPKLFRGKVVLITGAAGGVGAACARLLAGLEARLVLSDCEPQALQTLVEELGGDSVALALAADLRSVRACEHLVQGAVAWQGRLDALINCAGVWVEGSSEEASEDDWQQCIDVNLKGLFFVCSRAIPALKTSRGVIVNVSSDAGVVGNGGAAIYCASKGGVTLLSKALAIELAPAGVRVNALCPADILSPMLRRQAEVFGQGKPGAYYQRLLDHYPQGESARFIAPEEVALNIAFLISPAAAAITGAHVMLDFGLTAGY
jgi:NAD(P)-dependent dehydrogenase (short-subunit alcohol dehydrogenase family)